MARVLLVDDDPEQLAIRGLLLESEGHQVVPAGSADEASRAYLETLPAVVLMDLRLPHTSDGLGLIRRIRAHSAAVRILVLSGWPADLEHSPEAVLVDVCLQKPANTGRLLELVGRLAVCLLCWLGALAGVAHGASSFKVRLEAPAEVVATLEMSSPGSSWERAGAEAAVAEVFVDDRRPFHVVLYAGAEPYRYRTFLGKLAAGEHTLRVERSSGHSAAGSGLNVSGARFDAIDAGNPLYRILLHAPVLFARPDTVGRFSDVPLLVYGEELREGGGTTLQYTALFSNEDGGTSTRALMARWGRTTDIEYVYRVRLDGAGRPARGTIQGRDHKEVPFDGRREDHHPLLMPFTANNMITAAADSPLRFQPAPILAELARGSREQVMDEHPVTYRVMAAELAREGRVRPFGVVDGDKISDARNYLYLEARVVNRDARVAAVARARGEGRWRASHLGRVDYAIDRSGWIRTTIELDPGTPAAGIAEIGFQCLAEPAGKDKPAAVAGLCRIEEVSRCFLLDRDWRPGADFWKLDPKPGGVAIPTGEMLAFDVAAWSSRSK